MTTTKITPLEDRAVIRVTGPDAEALLDGLITNSMARLATTPALHTGLLSPQGKILFDFFLTPCGDGFLIDIAAEHAEAFIKRMTFYRLRANVEFEDISKRVCVAAAWPGPVDIAGGIIAYPDPRHRELGQRLIVPPERINEIPAEATTPDTYHAHRIALGIPAAGLDYPLQDTFPHEALYDQFGSVDFKKGCFIGQEVVSRMQHRGTARKRAIRVAADGPLLPRSPVTAGAATIGTIGSSHGRTAIAMLRLDRAAEASKKGIALESNGTALQLAPPEWINFDPATGKPRNP